VAAALGSIPELRPVFAYGLFSFPPAPKGELSPSSYLGGPGVHRTKSVGFWFYHPRSPGLSCM